MPHRFYAPSLTETGSVTLIDTECHHLNHVLRLRESDLVEVFDGNGGAATCRIQSLQKRSVVLEVIDFRQDSNSLPDLTIATAVPKGDRFEWLVEKATELGVHRIIPLVTSRSVVDPRENKLDRLRQTVIAACKQSGRNQLMEITPVTHWTEFLVAISTNYHTLIAHPSPRGNPVTEHALSDRSRPILIAIGPEGGFSDEEIEAALAAGAVPIRLGDHILRIETAVIAIAAKILL
jgi:16S rRNA (uracil1498-N3)-methyltransferase